MNVSKSTKDGKILEFSRCNEDSTGKSRAMRRSKAITFLLTIIVVNLGALIWFMQAPSFDGTGRPNEMEFPTKIVEDGEKNDKQGQRSVFDVGQSVLFDEAENLPKDSIFFIENSDRDSLNPLALCSVESAAKHNPSSPVVLLRTSLVGTIWTRELGNLVASYDNVALSYFRPNRLVLETPVASLWFDQKLDKSRYGLSHTSDVLRLALLIKYGGTYVDTDIITLGPHPSVASTPNFVNFEEKGSINGAMMRFEAHNPTLEFAAQRLAQYFNPRKWASNGPRLLSTSLATKCNITAAEFDNVMSLGKDDICLGIRSFDSSAVFSVHYDNWKWLFQPQHFKDVEEALQNSFATHLWGHFFNQQIQWRHLKPDQPVYHILKSNCPSIMSSMT